MEAVKRPARERLGKSNEHFFCLCLGKVNVEGWEQDLGRHMIAKVVDEGIKWIARGAGRGSAAGMLANRMESVKSDRTDTYDSQKELHKKTE